MRDATKSESSANIAVTNSFKQKLLDDISNLIEQSRQNVVSLASSTLTLLFWNIGELINDVVLQNKRADYGNRIVATLSRQLSWSHFVDLLLLKTIEARLFCAQEAIKQQLGVRDLRKLISRKAFERSETANSQLVSDSHIPFDTFKDPYLLDFLGLKDDDLENDLETAILRV